MPRWLWREGRLSWGVVGAVVFITVSLIAFDLAWRLLTLRFETLLIYALPIDFAAALAVLALARAVIRWQRQQR